LVFPSPLKSGKVVSKDRLSKIYFISSGSNGEVYNGTIEGINIAVKKQPLNEFQNTNIMITSTDGNIVN